MHSDYLKPCHPGMSKLTRYHVSILFKLSKKLKIDFLKLKLFSDGKLMHLMKTKTKCLGVVSEVDVVMYVEETFWRLEFTYTPTDKKSLRISEKY